jgi:hypothetical protein
MRVKCLTEDSDRAWTESMEGEQLGFAVLGHLLKPGHPDCSQRPRRRRTYFGESVPVIRPFSRSVA